MTILERVVLDTTNPDLRVILIPDPLAPRKERWGVWANEGRVFGALTRHPTLDEAMVAGVNWLRARGVGVTQP